jgi:hypothetical protein
MYYVWLRLTVNLSVSLGVERQLGLMTRYVLRLTVTVLFSVGAPSLMRGRVCHLYMLLALASAIFLGSESLGTRDHILLSQIWDFPYRRLLRLAGSRWRYSTPLSDGVDFSAFLEPLKARPRYSCSCYSLYTLRVNIRILTRRSLASNWSSVDEDLRAQVKVRRVSRRAQTWRARAMWTGL